MSAKTTSYIDSVMKAAYKPNEPGGVLLIAKNGKTIFKKAYGLANMELNVANKTDNTFCIGSMTKQFTVVAVLQLAQQGKISLQDDIKKYLPDYNTQGRSITIEHLLTQTSGIPDFTEKKVIGKVDTTDLTFSEEDEKKYFMNDPLLFEPGNDWSYDNSGFFLLAFIIEKVSGLSDNQYIQKNIFDVVNMTHSSFGTHKKIIPGLVNGYSSGENNQLRPANYVNGWDWIIGGGNIISTVDDLLKWDEALYTDKLVSQQLLQKAWTPYQLTNGNKMYYGFGWAIQTVNDIKCIQHGGEISGYMSNGVRIPSEHLYVTLLTNTTAHFPYYLSFNIAMKAANHPIVKPIVKTLSDKEMQEYQGAFLVHHFSDLDICCFLVTGQETNQSVYRFIQVRNDTLYEQIGDESNTLIYMGNDKFYYKAHDNEFLKFNRNQNKEIVSVEVYSLPAYGPVEIEEKKNVPLPK